METRNVFLAILISMAILLGYQYFFIPQQPPPQQQTQTEKKEAETGTPSADRPVNAGQPIADSEVKRLEAETDSEAGTSSRQAREIFVETPLYETVLSEAGGIIKSFKLMKYKKSLGEHSEPKELVTVKQRDKRELPLFFSWGVEPQRAWVPVYEADKLKIDTTDNGEGAVTMQSRMPSGLVLTRTMLFHEDNYMMDMIIDIHNTNDHPLQGAPYLSTTHKVLGKEASNRFLFKGVAAWVDGGLEEIKGEDLVEDGPQTLRGDIKWAAYEDNYFMCGLIPKGHAAESGLNVRLAAFDETTFNILVSANADVIAADGHQQYEYTIYYGPKELKSLRKAGHELSNIVNFGWFGFVAKPLLYLLNFFYDLSKNYGVAIILLTVLVKLLFWPLTHKGMKSMRNMQKLQPKLQKIREKYKGDKERLAQEQMRLYQTYKINPLGGCMPMLLQIPVFFALYRVLMQAIELRHAPFMLWINDLSAPERLSLGFEIPWLGGLPVLTLIMGASMFLQQKLTPTPSTSPEQQKIMMFLPVVFTFLFINFASGLVLYFLVNNLLSIAQQYFINKSVHAE
mgnify:CR=1 FL=1